MTLGGVALKLRTAAVSLFWGESKKRDLGKGRFLWLMDEGKKDELSSTTFCLLAAGS